MRNDQIRPEVVSFGRALQKQVELMFAMWLIKLHFHVRMAEFRSEWIKQRAVVAATVVKTRLHMLRVDQRHHLRLLDFQLAFRYMWQQDLWVAFHAMIIKVHRIMLMRRRYL